MDTYRGIGFSVAADVVQELSSIGIDVISEVKEAIDKDLDTMKATVYSKPNCPFCDRAKMLLKNKGVEITEVSAVENREQLIEAVTKETGAAPRTVPQIWLDGKYVGGYTELEAHFKG